MKPDAVLLVAFGGPTAPGEIRPFLELVTRGRRIPAERLEEVAHHYEQMPGGRSPLNDRTFAQARAHKGAPSVILAHTVMGQGISYMADDYRWHGKPPKKDEGERALVELGTTYDAWKARLLAG